tara:strand:+ start:92 stop:604 length:513 start_codon:yes stop_codon:yes gene_type:complete
MKWHYQQLALIKTVRDRLNEPVGSETTDTETVIFSMSNHVGHVWCTEFKFQVDGSWVLWDDLTGSPTFSANFDYGNLSTYAHDKALDGLVNNAGWWQLSTGRPDPVTITFDFDSASGETITGIKYISASQALYSGGTCDIDIEVDGVDEVTGASISPGTAGTNWENDFTW